MAITLRQQKEHPLTHQELDGNFVELDRRLKKLEQVEIFGEGVKEVCLEGDHFIFKSSVGDILGRCLIPSPIVCGRGVWKPQTPYARNDFVGWDHKLYICANNHLSSEKFEGAQENWNLLIDFSTMVGS